MENAAAPDDSRPRRGQEFTHANFFQVGGDGTRTPAIMKVTSIRRDVVFYTYADSPTNKGDWRMSIKDWALRYATPDNNPLGEAHAGADSPDTHEELT